MSLVCPSLYPTVTSRWPPSLDHFDSTVGNWEHMDELSESQRAAASWQPDGVGSKAQGRGPPSGARGPAGGRTPATAQEGEEAGGGEGAEVGEVE